MANDAIETNASDLPIAPNLFPIMAANYTTAIGSVKTCEKSFRSESPAAGEGQRSRCGPLPLLEKVSW